jgi:hypothetical protein
LKDKNQRVALSIFGWRITGMMKEYDVSMAKALQWDFEGFGYDVRQCLMENSLEEDFMFYLWQNNVFGSKEGELFLNVFLGRAEDMIIKREL